MSLLPVQRKYWIKKLHWLHDLQTSLIFTFFSSQPETDLIERRRRVLCINTQLLTAKELMSEFSSRRLPGSTRGRQRLRDDPTRPGHFGRRDL